MKYFMRPDFGTNKAGKTGIVILPYIGLIYHYKIPCVGENVQWCFKIQIDGDETAFFYDDIQGFNYQWGYTYTISVEKRNNRNPMADASSFTYKLKKLLNKGKVPENETFELPLRIDEHLLIENKNGVCLYFGNVEIQTTPYSFEELVKGHSAIFRHSQVKKGSELVEIR